MSLQGVLWLKDAACKDADQKFFVAYDDNNIAIAKQYCAICPVREPCAESYWDVMCVAGGYTKFERLKLSWKRIDNIEDSNWRRPDKLFPPN